MANDRTILCWIHIPCEYPDGTSVPEEKLNAFLEVLDRQFGGASPLGVISGWWQGSVEPMLRIEVGVKETDVERFETVALEIGKDTRQQAMYVVINYQSEVHLLFTDDDEETKHHTGTDRR